MRRFSLFALLLLACAGRAADLNDLPANAFVEVKHTNPFRGAIALTLTYENASKDAVALWANGDPTGEGFPGETFEVTAGGRTTAYKVFAVDPQADKVTIEPGKSWKRTIKDLAPVLSGTGVAIDGKLPDADPLPDPFGRLDDYALRVTFKSEVKGQPKPAFNGPVESNAVKFKVVRR